MSLEGDRQRGEGFWNSRPIDFIYSERDECGDMRVGGSSDGWIPSIHMELDDDLHLSRLGVKCRVSALASVDHRKGVGYQDQ